MDQNCQHLAAKYNFSFDVIELLWDKYGPRTEEIVKAATKDKFDLIVIGHRGFDVFIPRDDILVGFKRLFKLSLEISNKAI